MLLTSVFCSEYTVVQDECSRSLALFCTTKEGPIGVEASCQLGTVCHMLYTFRDRKMMLYEGIGSCALLCTPVYTDPLHMNNSGKEGTQCQVYSLKKDS